MKVLLFLAAVGGAVYYFFVGEQGAKRRAQAQERARELVGRGKAAAEEAGEAVSAEAESMKEKAQDAAKQAADVDDQTLKQKVETEVLGGEAPKGQVDVNVANGVVTLRGELEQPGLIEDLEQRVRKVQGVRGVENLLQASGTQPPTT
jgi:osmotically-inducible protein OsmY